MNNITTTEAFKVPQVYKAISAVSNELLDGIAKSQKNTQQGFMFRGIDQVYNALAPALVKCGLVVIPRVKSIERAERQTQKGGVLFYVVAQCEFDFICVEDGSKHTMQIFGEAMDSGDKATNKAMAIAYKYACFQTFCIPTEDTSEDPDKTTHNDLLPKAPLPLPAPKKQAMSKELFDRACKALHEGGEKAEATLSSLDKFELTTAQKNEVRNILNEGGHQQ